MIIFLDESGDLGFDFDEKKPSNHFVITLLVCHGKPALDSFNVAVKRTLKNKLNHNRHGKVIEELHAVADAFEVKCYFYRQLKCFDWQLYTVVLNKRRVSQHLTTKAGKQKLYNFLSKYLLDQVELSADIDAVTLVVDKSKNKKEIADFNFYLKNQLDARLPLNTLVYVYHENSKANYGLQAVDSFCWGIYRNYESQDLRWYEVFQRQIMFETLYLT